MSIFKFIRNEEVCRIKAIAKKYEDVEFLQYQHINPQLKELTSGPLGIPKPLLADSADSVAIIKEEKGPKKSAARYDQYRVAKSPKTFKELGGKSDDLIRDFEHGYVIFDIKKIEDSHYAAECHTDMIHLTYIERLMTVRKNKDQTAQGRRTVRTRTSHRELKH